MNRRPGLVAGGMLLLTFTIGGLAGMALEEALGLDWFDFLDEDNRAAGDDLLAGLSLTDGQRERVDEILDRQEDRLEEYWESRVPELRAVVAGSYQEIRGVLTPGQRTVFDRRVQARGIPLPRSD